MPRYRRHCPEGRVQHVLSRFVDRGFRLAGAVERDDYLARVGPAVHGSGWQPLAFARMSSHVHHAFLAGAAPLAHRARPLHSGAAGALDRCQGRLGPVFAGRPMNVGVGPDRVACVIAYVHNNPVRAGLVHDRADSEWTSHRAFLGEVAPPLDLCGFDASPRGRMAFHEFVRSRAGDPRDPDLCGDAMPALRRAAREACRAPAEISTSHRVDDARVESSVLLPHQAPRRARWPGDVAVLPAGACRGARRGAGGSRYVASADARRRAGAAARRARGRAARVPPA